MLKNKQFARIRKNRSYYYSVWYQKSITNLKKNHFLFFYSFSCIHLSWNCSFQILIKKSRGKWPDDALATTTLFRMVLIPPNLFGKDKCRILLYIITYIYKALLTCQESFFFGSSWSYSWKDFKNLLIT